MKKYLLMICFIFLLSSQCMASQLQGKYTLDEVNGKTFEICKGNIAIVQAFGKGTKTNPEALEKKSGYSFGSNASNINLPAYNERKGVFVIRLKNEKQVTYTIPTDSGKTCSFTVKRINHKFSNGRCTKCGFKKEKRVYSDLLTIKRSVNKFKEGKHLNDSYRYRLKWDYFNNNHVQFPVAYGGYSVNGGTGCGAFAFEVSDMIFCKNKYSDKKLRNINYFAHKNLSKIKTGDIVEMKDSGDYHTVVIMKKNKNYVTVAEANYGGRVHWGRKIKMKNLKKMAIFVLTRYPYYNFK